MALGESLGWTGIRKPVRKVFSQLVVRNRAAKAPLPSSFVFVPRASSLGQVLLSEPKPKKWPLSCPRPSMDRRPVRSQGSRDFASNSRRCAPGSFSAVPTCRGW